MDGIVNVHGLSLYGPAYAAQQLLQLLQPIQVGGEGFHGVKCVLQGEGRAFKNQLVAGIEVAYAHFHGLGIGIAAYAGEDRD